MIQVLFKVLFIVLLATNYVAFADTGKVTGVFVHSSKNIIVTLGTEEFGLDESGTLSGSVTDVYYGSSNSDYIYPLIMANHSRIVKIDSKDTANRKILAGFYAPSRLNPDRFARLVFSFKQTERMPKIIVQCEGKTACFRHNDEVFETVKAKINSGEMELAPRHSARFIRRAYRFMKGRDGVFLLIETERYVDVSRGVVHLGRKNDFFTIRAPFIWDPQPESEKFHTLPDQFRGGSFEVVSFEEPESGVKFNIRYINHDPNNIELNVGKLKIPLAEFEVDEKFLADFGLPKSDYFPLHYANPCELLFAK